MCAKNILLPIVVAFLSLGFVCLHAFAEGEIVNVVFLHTGDTAGQLYSFTPSDESLSGIGATFKPVGGVAKRHIFVNTKRQNKKLAWVLVDSGGYFGGSLLSSLYEGYVDIEMMNKLKYDFAGVGMSEFRFGQQALKERMSLAKFPMLCANIKDATGADFAKPYEIKEIDGLKVAFIGLIAGDAASYANPKYFEGLTVSDPVETAKNLVVELKKKSDVIVALTYQGVGADIALANAVPDLDIIFGAGSDTELELPMRMGDTLIVHAGKWGENVGMLKVTFQNGGDAGWSIRYFDDALVPMDGKWKENTDILKILNDYNAKLAAKLGAVVTELPAELDAKTIKASESALGDLAADVAREYAGADCAFITAASIRNGLPQGPVTVNDVFKAFPCDHKLVSYELSGAELYALLCESADKVGASGFPQVSGVNFGIFDGTAYEVTAKGLDLVIDGAYTVVTTDFVAEGGDGYSVFQGKTPLLYTGSTLRDVVEKYLKEHTGVKPVVEGRVYFLEAPSTAPQPVIETPVEPVTDTGDLGVAGDGGETTLPDEGLINMDEAVVETGDTTEAGGQPPMIQEIYLGIADLTKDELHYAFAVMPRLEDGKQLYEFRLVVTNESEVNKLVNFPTAQRVDFFVKEDERIVWNFGFWRYWAPLVDSTTILPGESLTFSAYWDGNENTGLPAARKLYRFEAQFLATVGVPVGFKTLLEWKEPSEVVATQPASESSDEASDETGGETGEEAGGETTPPAGGWF